jgi:DNA-binding transcriptional ArsR family regulator
MTRRVSPRPRPAPIFAALGDDTRLAVIDRLGTAGPQSIVALTAGTALTRQAMTKHLHVLARAGLVSDTRAGRERIWELVPAPLATARTYLEHAAARWDARIARLRALVET